MRFRKLPVVVDAFQMTLEHRQSSVDWPEWLFEAWNRERGKIGSVYPTVPGTSIGTITVVTLSGGVIVEQDWWIIRGVNGELYPCKPDIFEKTYEQDIGAQWASAWP